MGEDGCAACSCQRELQYKHTWDGVYTAWIGIGPQTCLFRITAFFEIAKPRWEERVPFASSVPCSQISAGAYEGTGCVCCYCIADAAWEAWECILGGIFWVWVWCRFRCRWKWKHDEKGMGCRQSAQGPRRSGSCPSRRSR